MSKPMLYKTAPRWQIWAALAGSIAIHLGGVAAANMKGVPVAGGVIDDPPIVTIETPNEPAPEETPPPEDIPLLVPPTPIEDSLFTEATPPPILRKSPARAPILRKTNPGPAVPVSVGAAKVAALNAPRPDYPYEARRQHATGSGVAVLYIDQATGVVTSVSMTQSTGNAILDNATVSAFRRWRFKPGTISAVRTPITFTMTGAQY